MRSPVHTHNSSRAAVGFWFSVISLMLVIQFFNVSKASGFDSGTVRISLLHNEFLTTARIQALSGDWKARFNHIPAASDDSTATGTKAVFSEETIHFLNEGEDIALMVVKKGIVAKSSREDHFDEGYASVEIFGGELLSVEYPNFPPLILKGVFRLTLEDSSISSVNAVTVKEYLVSTVSESFFSVEPEALKAGIVTSRTRLHHHLSMATSTHPLFDITDSCEVMPFSGAGVNREMVEILTNQVSNEVILYRGKTPFPRHHHTCGGRISSAADVFGKEEAIHQAKDDRTSDRGSENCFHSPSFHWIREFSKQELADFISVAFAGGAEKIYLQWIPLSTDPAGRLKEIELRGRLNRKVSGVEFLRAAHQYYGENSIKSMRFTTEPMRRRTILRGMGSGHGVGMCMFGADGMAKKRMSYKQILSFYYSGITLGKAPAIIRRRQ